MRILFLSRWYPFPPDNGSKLRVHSLLRGLCEHHDVTLISFRDPTEKVATPSFAGRGPSDIRVCPYREFQPTSRRAFLGYLSSVPRYLVDTYNPEMERLIQEVVRTTRYDLVVASQLPMAAYYKSFRGIPAIFEEVELGFYARRDALDRSSWRGFRRTLTWAKHRRFVSQLLDNFMLCTVASDVERQLLASAAPDYKAVHVIPNSVDAGPAGDAAAARFPDSLIFAGSLRYAPNRDAMDWFLSEIFPAVRAEVPGARLTITGDPGSQPLPAASNVVLTGQVADVRSLVAKSAVSLAPIRVGGGTRLKILEAMAVGTPVVATTKAAEGLEARDGVHLLVADTAHEFAGAVRGLLRDPARAREMAQRARSLFLARYDSGVVVPAFLRLVDHAAAA